MRTSSELAHNCPPLCYNRFWGSSHVSQGLNKQPKNVCAVSSVARYFCTRQDKVALGSDEQNTTYLACLDPTGEKSTLMVFALAVHLLKVEFGHQIVDQCVPIFRNDEDDTDDLRWPELVEQDIIIQSLTDYYKNTIWIPPVACAVCGRIKFGVKTDMIPSEEFGVLAGNTLDFALSGLSSTFETLFLFGDKFLDGKILDRNALIYKEGHPYNVMVCEECKGSLKGGHVPRFSLANGLFHRNCPQGSIT